VAVQDGSLNELAAGDVLNTNATIGILTDVSYAGTNVQEVDAVVNATVDGADITVSYRPDKLPTGAGYAAATVYQIMYSSVNTAGTMVWSVSRAGTEALGNPILAKHRPKG